MDEVGRYNQNRWDALAAADALFTSPNLALTPESAQHLVDPDGRLGEIAGKDVLCLASGGGQQSAAFAILGARVTVLDLSLEQVKRDREAAEHYGLQIKAFHGDMRDMSCFGEASFDIVFQPYSINFVPGPGDVFRGVARLMRVGGRYQVTFANPFVAGIQQAGWNGNGYSLNSPYIEGAVISYDDQEWVYRRDKTGSVPPPIEYRHTLGAVLNGLIDSGFSLLHLSDNLNMHPDPNAAPGSWEHQVAYAPPWLSVWALYRPDLLEIE
ncbi:MAG: class I SAM-dependent methyltransferase [Acidobacteriota bacterium]